MEKNIAREDLAREIYVKCIIHNAEKGVTIVSAQQCFSIADTFYEELSKQRKELRK